MNKNEATRAKESSQSQLLTAAIVEVIRETKNYHWFSFLIGNRDVKDIHLKRLKQSISLRLLFTIIIVNELGVIIDGQHRFLVMKLLGLPIKFIICNGYGRGEVTTYNTTNINWGAQDYLDSFCKDGFAEYLKMRDFMNLFPDFKIASSRVFLTQLFGGKKQGTIEGQKIGNNQDFENGLFKIPDWHKSIQMAEKHMMFKPYFEKYFSEVVFVQAMLKLYQNPNYNHAYLINRVSKYPSQLTPCKNTEQYRLLIETIYNKERGKDKKVNLRY